MYLAVYFRGKPRVAVAYSGTTGRVADARRPALLATLVEGPGPRRGSRSGADPDYRGWHLPLVPGLLDFDRLVPGPDGQKLGILRSPILAAPAEGPGHLAGTPGSH